MLASHSHLRSLLSLSPRTQSCCTRRSFFITASRWAAEDSAEDEVADPEQSNLPLPANPPASRAAFFADERVKAFEHSSKRMWLGGDRPFPMNPSFVPPAPIPDAIKTRIYNLYMENPKLNNVRQLSARYHISLKRVDAILRLKGMEADWVKGKQLQLGFQGGMEKMLKPPPQAESEKDRRMAKQLNTDAAAREDLYKSDMLEQAENRDFARQKYQRMYWESIPEDGRDPIVPRSLEEAKGLATKMARMAEQSKSHMPKPHLTPDIVKDTPRVQKLERPGRPDVVFVDVGGKFLDADERQRRIKEADRRRMQRRKETTRN